MILRCSSPDVLASRHLLCTRVITSPPSSVAAGGSMPASVAICCRACHAGAYYRRRMMPLRLPERRALILSFFRFVCPARCLRALLFARCYASSPHARYARRHVTLRFFADICSQCRSPPFCRRLSIIVVAAAIATLMFVAVCHARY